MFRIGFTSEPLAKMDPNEDGCVGLLVLGEHEERFATHFGTWSEQQYVNQWRSALNRALDGKPAALITDMQTPAQSSHLVWWPMWRINEGVVFHNQLFFFAKHKVQGTRVDLELLYGFIRERRSRNDKGTPLSEWTVPVSDIEKFVTNVVP
jgi:CdiI N-terminal domain